MLLLDTCTLIWLGYGSKQLPSRVRDRLAREAVMISEISLCEIVIKEQARSMTFGIDFDRLIDVAGFGRAPLPVGAASHLAALPMLHSDPFYRLLVAHAQHENWTLVTCDAKMRRYDVATTW